jgi:glycosyltransferase involved in cell wall biosynthesis
MNAPAAAGITLIVPYYRNAAMLCEQAKEWLLYPPELRVILVDDGSPEPALPIIKQIGHSEALEVYRIGVDIPWNRGGARNLGAHQATTDWIMHVDIDHVLPAGCAADLLGMVPMLNTKRWYRFPRFRRGRADETRRKDKIPDDVEFGEIHPHVDSYLCRRSLYWKTGGYDEDYSGCLGGGSPFLKRLEERAPVEIIKHRDVFLVVYTRSACQDASDFSLSRDTSEYSRRRKAKEAKRDTEPRNTLRFPWERVL